MHVFHMWLCMHPVHLSICVIIAGQIFHNGLCFAPLCNSDNVRPLWDTQLSPVFHLVCVPVSFHTHTIGFSIIKWSCDLIVGREVQPLVFREDRLRER